LFFLLCCLTQKNRNITPMRKFGLMLILWVGTLSFTTAQGALELPPALGISGGIRIDLGVPVNQIGFNLQGYYSWDFVQLNAGIGLVRVFSHLGPRPLQPGWELTSYLGTTVGFGPRIQDPSPFLHPVSNQTRRAYAVGYAWKGYLDKRETSQLTGLLAVHIGPWEIISENDAYTGMIDDKFRTGTLSVAYKRDSIRLAMTTILWTGDPRSEGVTRSREGGGKHGYKNLFDGKHGRFSHGILTVEGEVALPYYQRARASLGLDAEQIRHGLQNRLIHDMMFLPDGWVKTTNAHYPMLDTEGKPYLGNSGQKVRPIRPYLMLSLNPSLFY